MLAATPLTVTVARVSLTVPMVRSLTRPVTATAGVETTAPSAGNVIETAGGVVSAMTRTAAVPMLPAASSATATSSLAPSCRPSSSMTNVPEPSCAATPLTRTERAAGETVPATRTRATPARKSGTGSAIAIAMGNWRTKSKAAVASLPRRSVARAVRVCAPRASGGIWQVADDGPV